MLNGMYSHLFIMQYGWILKKYTVKNLKYKLVEVPWYSVLYAKEGDRVFSGKENFIIGKLPYKLKNNAIVTIVVRDKWGHIAKTLVEEAAMGPGPKEYDLNLDVKGWGNGVYTITIMEDYSNINSAFSFKID